MINLQFPWQFKTINLKWQGPSPHPYLEKKLGQLLTSKANLLSCEFHQLDFSLLKTLIEKKLISSQFKFKSSQIIKKGQQFIHSHNLHDQLLLTAGLKKSKPTEVLRISIKTRSKKIFFSKIIHGTHNLVSTPQYIERWIHKNITKLKYNGYEIVSIHIDHIHPSLEVMIKAPEKYLLVTNGLGSSDLLLAKNIADHLKYPLIVSAIIPSGLKYSAIF